MAVTQLIEFSKLIPTLLITLLSRVYQSLRYLEETAVVVGRARHGTLVLRLDKGQKLYDVVLVEGTVLGGLDDTPGALFIEEALRGSLERAGVAGVEVVEEAVVVPGADVNTFLLGVDKQVNVHQVHLLQGTPLGSLHYGGSLGQNGQEEEGQELLHVGHSRHRSTGKL